MTINQVCWLVMTVAWFALLYGFADARDDISRVRAQVAEVRASMWCPKVYQGMALEWKGETHLYTKNARTFSCRYKRSSAT